MERWRTGWGRWLACALVLAACSDADSGATGSKGDDVAVGDDATSGDDAAATPEAGGDAGAEDSGPVKVDVPVVTTLTLTSVQPDTGRATGLEQVELVGTGFNDNVQVYFGESLAQDIFVLDDRRIAALTPPRVPGLVDVRVTDPVAETSAVLDDAYLYFNPVMVAAVDPPSGSLLGGEPITVTGTGFVPGTVVIIGTRAALSVEVLDDGTLLAVTPEGTTAGPADVHVSNGLGIGTLEEGYTYTTAPVVTGVAPPVGLLAGGTKVEVTGVGFSEPLAVSFGGRPLEDVEVIGTERIVGRTPSADAAGTVDVLVSTTVGSAFAEDAFTYVGDLAPGEQVQILAVTPATGPAGGGNQVTVVAKGLTGEGATTVTFGGAAAQVLSVDPQAHAVVVEVPPGAVGPVDVTLANANGQDTRVAGYRYQAFVKVYEVTPSFGPVAGGTAVTLKGVGFEPGAQVRIGALPAASVQVVDDQTITAVTAAGSPGLANVTVTQGALQDVLVGGYAYQGPMALWVVAPNQGGQAGGTLVTLMGSGFPTDAQVLVGGKPATHVQVLSSSLIRGKTPPGDIGTVEVTVQSALKGSVSLPNAYTYYNPESSFGGTWGKPVKGDVNVTVLNGADGSAIPDVFVMLWTDPTTPYQGYTNQNGQITFSGPDLMGEQMVSASKEGFASNSVVEYDATNVTLYLNPTAMGSGGPPPSVPAPIYKGQVVNATKYIPVPWGQCNDKGATAGALCGACTTSADCAGGLTCNALPNQGSFCTSHCQDSGDCPSGYMCYPLNGVPEQQCVPASGRVTAFCDFTKPTVFSQDYVPPPGLEVLPDFSFEMPVPIGEFAVFCWGGIYNDDLAQFTPYALGLHRHVFAQPGEQLGGDIVLNHALKSEITLRLDDPPRGPNGPDFNYAFVHLNLGSDGTLEFLHQPFSFGVDEPLVFQWMPKALTGDLYDASYTFLAGAFSMTEDNLPYSLTLHQGIRKVEDDTMYVWEASGWTPRATGITKNINALWATSATQMVGVGSDGLIVRSLGSAWAAQPSGTTSHLRGVHALPGGAAIAVGDKGVATHFGGETWQVVPTGGTANLEGVWMFSPSDAVAVGWYTLLRWDGATWTKDPSFVTSKNLRAVWGSSPDDIWAVGFYGQAIHWDGVAWSNVPTGTTQNLRGVWGSGPDDVFIVGEGGTILRWDGTALTPMAVDTQRTLEAVWGSGPEDVYAVGARGTILRWDGVQWHDESPSDYDATFLAVGGAGGAVVATGTHELLLGPMLRVPENIKPADGGVMGDKYELSWTVQDGPQPHFSYVEVAVPGMMGPVPEWITINDWKVTNLLLPDFPNIEGTPGIAPGFKYLTILRVYKEGFDIDNYSYMDLSTLTWRSWAQDATTFTKK